jgi:hypothetical protein
MLDFGGAVQASFRSLPFGTNTPRARLTRSMSMSFYYSHRTHNCSNEAEKLVFRELRYRCTIPRDPAMPYSLLRQVHDADAKWKLCGFASSRHSLDLVDGCAVPRNRIAMCMGEMVQMYEKC